MEHTERDKRTPESPEGYPQPVRKQLDQREQTHEGERRAPEAQPGAEQQRGATEQEVTPIKPPMNGPADLVTPERDKSDDEIDPRDELTPG